MLLAASVAAIGQGAEEDTVVFGGSAYYPPFEWLDDDGRPRGFNIALEDAIAGIGGRNAVHRLMDWPSGLAALDRGEVDVTPMFHSKERSRRYLFTEPFYYVMHAIYGPPDARGITGPESLGGARVAVVAAGYAGSTLEELGIEGVLVPRANIAEALRAVVDGEADFALVARATAARFVEDRGFKLQALGPPFWPRPYVFAVKRDRPELAAWLNRSLRRVIASGRYHDVYAQWKDELEWSRPGWWDRIRRVSLILVPLFLLAAAGYFWSWQLRRRVAARTRELRAELEWRETAEEELRYLARHETLTQLPTRTEFVRLSEQALAARPDVANTALIAAVRLIELDRIILAFGYETGEQLLAEFGRRLGGMGFAAVGDFGRGIFFVLVLEDVKPGKLLKELSAPVELGQLELDPHFSIGVARYPDHGTAVGELVRKAETALADASGRNRTWVEYVATMEPDPNDLIIVRDFRRLGTGDIFSEFQPIIELRSMRMVGAEALARWRHPEFGLIGPEHFIPLLESAGVIYQLTERMIREAIRVGLDLRKRGLPLPVNVNVSAVDLLEGDLEASIGKKLAEVRAGPETLRLELTETSVIENPERMSKVVAGLLRMGILCSIDDFGVGYSSLSYLSEFPVHEVKIDRSFVTDMLANEQHAAIVRSIIVLAHQLQLGVVAEGVEDWATVETLKECGCDRAQGFVFSKPVGEDEIAALHGRVFEPGVRKP